MTLDKEKTGSLFEMHKMIQARNKTMQAVQNIASKIQVGMTEQEAKNIAKQELQAMGMERIWHGIIIRFGKSTIKTFNQPIDPDNKLMENDIFFIDLGVVWEGHEGDAGDSFVVGNAPDKQACAEAARTLWNEVRKKWIQDQCTGFDLYQYAETRASQMGWDLNLEIKGHRVCDFPHAIYKAGRLGDFSYCPNVGLWILEIQIAHPSGEYGAFFEDLLYKN